MDRIEAVRAGCATRIKIPGPLVISEPHFALAAIAAAMATFTEVITASVLRAEDANIA
jgi:hypothetical protein